MINHELLPETAMGRNVNAQNESESSYVKAVYEWVKTNWTKDSKNRTTVLLLFFNNTQTLLLFVTLLFNPSII